MRGRRRGPAVVDREYDIQCKPALIPQPAIRHDVRMYIRVFGGGETVLPDQWTEEIVFSAISACSAVVWSAYASGVSVS